MSDYRILTIGRSLTWWPYWQRATKKQRAILEQAHDMIREMHLALDRIRQVGSYTGRHFDAQCDVRPWYGTSLNREATIADETIRRLDTAAENGRRE